MRIFIYFLLFGVSYAYMWAHKAPIVFAIECDNLKTQLADASQGGKFLLMTDLTTDPHTAKEPIQIRDNLRFILQMSLLLRFYTGKPVVQLDTTHTKYLSDENKLRYSSHDDVVQSLNLVRGFIQGGIGDISHYEDWVVVENNEFKKSLSNIAGCVRFLEGFSHRQPILIDNYYTGHSARVSHYEKDMTRNDSVSNRTYACSSHFMWLEELPDPLMTNHLSQVQNPIGIVATDDTHHDFILGAIEKLNPLNEKGKITILVRMRMMNTNLPRLVETIRRRNYHVLWCCDPSCRSNLRSFLRIHEHKKTVVGGVFIRNRDIDTIQFLSKYIKSKPFSRQSQWNRFSM
jgi:3-deoxy-7-phosphoheptulonate synthase